MKIISLSVVVWMTVLIFSQSAYSCDDRKKVDDCDDVSEFTWNPAKTSENLNRFYDLEALIVQKYEQNNYDEAKKLIAEYLELADIYKNNWNYGNAIHDAYRILGLISYQQQNYDEATQYLIQAGQSPGSPQLNTFGPKLDLANELLKVGETAGVKTYLLGIRTFWEMDNGVVNAWVKAIDNGETPKLDRFAGLDMSPFQKMVNWIGLVWPIMVTIGCVLFYKRKKLSPWKFMPVAILIGYVVMVGSSVISSLAMVSLINILPASIVAPMIIVITVLAPFGLPLLAIILLTKATKLRRA